MQKYVFENQEKCKLSEKQHYDSVQNNRRITVEINENWNWISNETKSLVHVVGYSFPDPIRWSPIFPVTLYMQRAEYAQFESDCVSSREPL